MSSSLSYTFTFSLFELSHLVNFISVVSRLSVSGLMLSSLLNDDLSMVYIPMSPRRLIYLNSFIWHMFSGSFVRSSNTLQFHIGKMFWKMYPYINLENFIFQVKRSWSRLRRQILGRWVLVVLEWRRRNV